MKKRLLYIFAFISINCFAQFSKTHYIPPLISANGLVEDQYLYISTPSTKNVNLKIITIGGAVINATVTSTNPYIHAIGTGDNTQLFTPNTNIGIIKNKGYIIEAEDLIYVSARVNAGLNNNKGYNHAGGLVSKGNSALGTTFRLGAMLNPLFDTTLLNFACILSTENGTKITISNIENGTVFTDGTTINGPITVTLNKNESYVLALENYNVISTTSNSSKIIGALVESDKPVVVNSGSFGGSNSTVTAVNQNGVLVPTGRDVGFDQIVSLEKTGKEYIFVKGIGTDELERVLIVAHSDQTQVFLNGNATPFTTLNKGAYIAIDGSQFISGNLYVTTSQNVFAYQSIAGSNTPANQNLFFVPPINCSTPNTVDNIPLIQSIGNTVLSGVLNIVTEAGATVMLNNAAITTSAIPIVGNLSFVRYTIPNLSGNIAVKSTKQVYVSYFGTNGAATYGGYYSGFDLKPEIVSDKIVVSNAACIPNVTLKINSLSSYDIFQWYKDDVAISSATNNNYTPSQPGFYQVKGSVSGCISNVFSDKIPVSECATNGDNDLANDNIDVDYDNDGILNCTESYGDLNINSSNPNSGVVTTTSYSNAFTGTVNTSTTAAPIPFTGNVNGSFITEVLAGKGQNIAYRLNFNNPINLSLEYPTTANATDLLNTNAEYSVNSDIDKTVTVLNPTNQLLIDTNYDGIYESGVTQFSSFEIRFRLNGSIPLPAGTGTFKFLSYQTKSFQITHKNLLDSNGNKSTFKLIATCILKDTDADGTPDQLDLDSDNDGIPDTIENQKVPKALSNTDTNLNGLDEIFKPITNPIDTDGDGVADYLDLDSDNDGIYDLIESGSQALDINKDGIIDGTAFGSNGLADALETTADNGILNYTVSDTDADGIKNHTELDSDNDLCNDVIEAGFTDPNFDGQLGNNPVTVNAKGIVTSYTNGYTTPNNNYIIANPIIITKQPTNQSQCLLQNATFSIASNADGYQWQLSTDGGTTWNSLANNTTYTGTNTASLLITKISTTQNAHQYRVLLNKTNSDCGLISAAATLAILPLPVLNSAITIVQCDDDTDGVSTFNLTEKNSFVSANYSNETFTYYTTLAGANTKNPAALISNPIAYTSATNSIWTRVENANGCFNVGQLNLMVSTTQINSTFNRTFEVCDDYIDPNNDDKDGISIFDFTPITTDIQSLLPASSSNYSIKFYGTEVDALAETNPILNTSNYRNTTPNQQQIWVRVENNFDNSCFGLGAYITLQVNPTPNIDPNNNHTSDKIVCLNLPNVFAKLDAGLIGNTPFSAYTYLWTKDNIAVPGETNDTLEVNKVGVYTLTVSTQKNCRSSRTIKVTSSDIAHLDSITVQDLSDHNTITVNSTGQGNYEYSLDLPNGPFQELNFFDHVPSGIHDVFINDTKGCGVLKKTISVLGVPAFFSPNNDGYNDYWNVRGVNETLNKGAQIFIYDRYGKVIKQILPSSNGWDGTYTGNPMPQDDYWYSLKLEDGRESKGHFSLKR